MVRKIGVIFLVVSFVFSTLVPAEEPAVSNDTLSLNFKDTDIKIVLQALSAKSGINIVLTPAVSGPVSIKLKDVDWQTALDVLLKTYDYGFEWVGDEIIMVDDLNSLTEKRQKQAESKAGEPARTKIFVLNFAKVSDVEATVKNMLSPRGTLVTDVRTNTIVITDTSDNLTALEKTIERLDKITPQVMIEAKVIEVQEGVLDDIGFQWSTEILANGAMHAHSFPFVLPSSHRYFDIYPTSFDTNLGIVKTVTETSDLNFGHGVIDFTGFATLFEMLKTDNRVDVLSEPRVTTLDNHEATINVLTKDPVPNYSFNSDTGQWEITGFESVEYGVQLKVTPQINDDGYVTLTVLPTISDKIDTREFTAGGSASTVEIPVISEQLTNTKVMIKDGDTLVIGGMKKEKVTKQSSRVPFVSKVPFLGKLFEHEYTYKTTVELVIFITPTIVTPKKDTKDIEEETDAADASAGIRESAADTVQSQDAQIPEEYEDEESSETFVESEVETTDQVIKAKIRTVEETTVRTEETADIKPTVRKDSVEFSGNQGIVDKTEDTGKNNYAYTEVSDAVVKSAASADVKKSSSTVKETAVDSKMSRKERKRKNIKIVEPIDKSDEEIIKEVLMEDGMSEAEAMELLQ